MIYNLTEAEQYHVYQTIYWLNAGKKICLNEVYFSNDQFRSILLGFIRSGQCC